jgi:hypothetical protein
MQARRAPPGRAHPARSPHLYPADAHFLDQLREHPRVAAGSGWVSCGCGPARQARAAGAGAHHQAASTPPFDRGPRLPRHGCRYVDVIWGHDTTRIRGQGAGVHSHQSCFAGLARRLAGNRSGPRTWPEGGEAPLQNTPAADQPRQPCPCVRPWLRVNHKLPIQPAPARPSRGSLPRCDRRTGRQAPWTTVRCGCWRPGVPRVCWRVPTQPWRAPGPAGCPPNRADGAVHQAGGRGKGQ